MELMNPINSAGLDARPEDLSLRLLWFLFEAPIYITEDKRKGVLFLSQGKGLERFLPQARKELLKDLHDLSLRYGPKKIYETLESLSKEGIIVRDVVEHSNPYRVIRYELKIE